MRIITVKNETARLPEKDYQQLLRRFTPDKAKLQYGEYTINRICLCHKYQGYGCGRCPFRMFELRDMIGCMLMLRKLKLKTNHIMLATDEITWYKVDDKKARKEVQAIKDWLLSLPREE